MMNNAYGVPLNCGSFIGANVPIYSFKKPKIGGDAFELIVNPITRIISASTSGIINQYDSLMVRNSGATTITDYQVRIQPIIPGNYTTNIYSNNSGIIISPNSIGLASGISAGSTYLLATSSDGLFSRANVTINSTIGVVSDTFQSYVNGSLAKSVSEAIDNRISSKNPESSKPIYSTQDHTTPTYVRNIDCWASDIDLTCISPWNSTENNNRAGTLISPRHIIFAAHYQIDNGATIRFVDNNNNVITRTMVTKLTHPSYTPYYPDISIGILNSDVPSSIKFAKILPQNWSTYLPNLSLTHKVPCLALDQEEKALILDLYLLNTVVAFAIPSNPTRFGFFESIVSGDSGNPVFLIINGELVILTTWTYSGSGTSILYHKDVINNMMETLGGGYSLTEINLNGFNTY